MSARAAALGAAVSAVLVLAPVLAACTVPDGGTNVSPAATSPVPDDVGAALRVEVRQDRSQYADRRAVLHVTNGSAQTLTLLDGHLAADGFGPSRPDGEPRPRTLRPDGARDVRIALGEADCATAPAAVGPREPVGTAEVSVALGEAGTHGPQTTVVLDVTDPHGRLAVVHAEECALARIAAGATLTVEGLDRPADPAGAARLEIGVTPVPGGPEVLVTRVGATTLMAPADGGEGWTGASLSGRDSRRLRLDVVPARCDPHAVAEDKRGTFVPVYATVDGEEQPVVYLPLPDEAAAELFAFLHDACGWE